MTHDRALSHLRPENYKAYQALGGRLCEDDYRTVAAEFLVYTYAAYVCGEGSRLVAIRRYSRWLAGAYPVEKAGVIFVSIDRVSSYT